MLDPTFWLDDPAIVVPSTTQPYRIMDRTGIWLKLQKMDPHSHLAFWLDEKDNPIFFQREFNHQTKDGTSIAYERLCSPVCAYDPETRTAEVGIVPFSKSNFMELRKINKVNPFFDKDVVVSRDTRQGFLRFAFHSASSRLLGGGLDVMHLQSALNALAQRIQRGDPL